MTGVIVRSSANVNSGAKTRASTILHGLWLLVFVAAIPAVLTYIPKSALGALLVYTGFKLVNIKDIKSLWRTSRGECAVYFATVTMIIATDLLIGVLVGVALSALKIFVHLSNLKVQRDVEESGQKVDLRLTGTATFLCLPKLAAELERIPAGSTVHIVSEDLTYIDHACLDLLSSWSAQHASLGGEAVVDWDQLHAAYS